MKILLASSEVHPFSKTGGLADMIGALAKAFARAGHRVGVVTPLYRGIRDRFPQIRPLDPQVMVPLGTREAQAAVWTLDSPDGATIYFVEQSSFFDRASLYHEQGRDYPDNAERFIFFSKAVTHLARHLPWQPEIVHGHDWQAGFVPLLIRHQSWHEGWTKRPRLCFTIHNLAYQGVFPAASYGLTNLPWYYFNADGVEFYGNMNCLKAGIAFADVITTVSPRYAREIMTEEFGCGLDGLLRHRQGSLHGILNGVDYDEWNTTQNPHLKHPYSVRALHGKTTAKLDLQQELGLPVSADVPLFGSITRLTEQKGLDILLGALEEMLAAEMQFVLLGNGSPAYEQAFRELAQRHPQKVAARIGFDQALSHRIEAACDFYLMPSRFEPCGLNQMYSQRYGAIPIVRRTGGLDDTVVDVWDDPDKATGIKFSEYSPAALAKAIRKALVLYQQPALTRHFRRNGMQADFSWERTGQEYLRLFCMHEKVLAK